MAEEKVPDVSAPRVEVLDTGAHVETYSLYMKWIPVSQIAKMTGKSLHSIRSLILTKGWKQERANLARDIKKAVKAQAIQRLSSITNNGLAIVDASIKQALRTYREQKRAPSVIEARIVMQLVQAAHMMKIHEEGQGVSEGALAMSPDEVISSFMNDPYMRKAMEAGSLPELPPLNLGISDEDSIGPRNSERSASQEARASAERTE